MRHVKTSEIHCNTQDLTKEDFRNSNVIQNAVIRELEIIGEAARVVSEATKRARPDIPWYQISGMRNRLIHEYFAVDLDAVWKTITEDLDTLNDGLQEAA
jgi:uncharacterized protein with HEPN domain